MQKAIAKSGGWGYIEELILCYSKNSNFELLRPLIAIIEIALSLFNHRQEHHKNLASNLMLGKKNASEEAIMIICRDGYRV